MAIVPQCVIGKFLNASCENEVEEEAHKLLSAFFESNDVRNIEWSGNIHSASEAVRKLSAQVALQNPSGLSVAEIINRVSENRGAVVFQGGNAAMGVTFSVCDNGSSKNRWMLYLSCGPVPMLDLRTNHGRGFNPQRQWGEAFFERGVAHVVWLDGAFGMGRKKCYGDGDNQYLFWKRQGLMSEVPFKGVPSPQAIQAGIALRQICHNVYELQRKNPGDDAILVSWAWKRTRLIKAFDRALINAAGIDKLTKILNTMGTTIDQWLAI